MTRSNARPVSHYDIVLNNEIVVVVGVNFKAQLDYFYYKTITPENKVFIPVRNSAITDDDSYNRYVLGFDKVGKRWGYWSNKDAKFLSYKFGPSVLVDKDRHKVFKEFKVNIDINKTEKKISGDLWMLKNYNLTRSTFKEIYDSQSNGTMFVIASVEFL